MSPKALRVAIRALQHEVEGAEMLRTETAEQLERAAELLELAQQQHREALEGLEGAREALDWLQGLKPSHSGADDQPEPAAVES